MSLANRPHDQPFLRGWYWLVPILALAAMRGFWAPDEPRYAEIAKEAFETGSFLVLHLCGELYPDKPPLVFWLAGLMGKLSGWSEFWMRAPSILATVGSAYCASRIARRWFDERIAAWTIAFYLGCAMVLEIGGRLQLDPILSVLVLGAIALWIDDKGTERAILRRTWLAGLCLGLGALVKGPVAWVPFGFAVATWALLPEPFRLRQRRSKTAWIGFVVLALSPVSAWAFFAIQSEPALLKPLLFGQHLGRITKGDQHPGPVWDHLLSLPVLLLPWTLHFVSGFAAAWKSFRRREDIGLVRIAAWFGIVFVFFSLIPPKRDLYLLPIYPAAAMITAFAFDRMSTTGRASRWMRVITAGSIAFIGCVLTVAPLLAAWIEAEHPRWLDGLGEAVHFARLGVPAGLVLMAAGAVAWFASARSRPKLWADAIGVGLASALTLLAVFLVPAVDVDKSAKDIAALTAARPERPTMLACIGVRPEGIRFYGGGPAVGVSSDRTPTRSSTERAGGAGSASTAFPRDVSGRDPTLEEVLDFEGAQFLAVCSDKEYDRLAPEVKARVREVARSRLGRRALLVLVSASEPSGSSR